MNLNESIMFFTNKELEYTQLKDEIVNILDENLKGLDVKIIEISSRIKDRDSLKFKIKNRNYSDPPTQVTDYAGVRIVCGYESEFNEIEKTIKKLFTIFDREDKTEELGVDKMGYQGRHYIVSLKKRVSKEKFSSLKNLCCEIQLRTILQNSWSIASHHLLYKRESIAPPNIRRDLNNVASLLEIAQQIFDRIRVSKNDYVKGIEKIPTNDKKFLSQEINFETLSSYTKRIYPDLKPSLKWQNRLLADLDRQRYKTLRDIDVVVQKADAAVNAYKKENPSWFKSGTGHITKALGFVDRNFREKHPFGGKTREAFQKYQNLVSN